MMIFIVACDLYPSVVGEIDLHAHNLLIEQCKDNTDITVYTRIPEKSK